jgi:hypothetical protein
VLLVFVWLSLLEFPAVIAGDELDSSWAQCLAYFAKHRMQAGVDYVFTFGPLALFTLPYVYDSGLFWPTYLLGLIIELLIAWGLVRLADRLPSVWMKLAFWLVAIVYLPPFACQELFLLLLIGLHLLRAEDRARTRVLWAGILAMAALALVNLIRTTYALGIWALLSGYWLSTRRYRSALVLLLGFPLALAGVWCLAGQALGNLPTFCWSSLELAGGYTDAMALQHAPADLAVAAAIIGLLACLVASYGWRVLLQGRALVVLMMVGGCMAMIWKHACVRQDAGHTLWFAVYGALVPFLLLAHFGAGLKRQALRGALTLGCVGLCVFAMSHFDGRWPSPGELAQRFSTRLLANARHVIRPRNLKRDLDRYLLVRQATFRLPRLAARVKDATIDLLGTQQGVVLLNGWHYQPRPVFQSYAAYTPLLQMQNAAYYEGSRAPGYVLVNMVPTDSRHPTLEEGPALLTILQRYWPVDTENGYLLLERRREPRGRPAAPGRVAWNKTIAFGEEVRLDDLPDVPEVLALRIRHTAWGKIRNALYRSPFIYITLRTTTGNTYVYRLVPGMAETGFLFNPLLRDNDQLQAFYRTGNGERVQSFRLAADDRTAGSSTSPCYEPAIEATLRLEPGLAAGGHRHTRGKLKCN